MILLSFGLLFRPNATPLMVKHSLVRDVAFQPPEVVIGVLLKHLWAVRTATKPDLMVGNLQHHSPLTRLLSQAARADDQIPRLG